MNAEDFTTPIPGLQGFPTSDVEESVLSPRNPSFYEAHPPHLVGPAQLYMKAVALLGKVVQFSHRAPHTIKNRASRLNDRKEDLRQTWVSQSSKLIARKQRGLSSLNPQGRLPSPRCDMRFVHRLDPARVPNRPPRCDGRPRRRPDGGPALPGALDRALVFDPATRAARGFVGSRGRGNAQVARERGRDLASDLYLAQ